MERTGWSGIINLLTQEPPPKMGGRPGKATVENVNHCLKALGKTIEAEQFSSVALPKLATGVEELDWKNVKPLIEKHLSGLGIPVIVYSTYRPGFKPSRIFERGTAEIGFGSALVRPLMRCS